MTPRPRNDNPAKVMMADLGGWTLRRKQPLDGRYGGLTFRYKAPSSHGDFLEVRVDSGEEATFPRVRVNSQHMAGRDGDWVEVVTGETLRSSMEMR